MRRGGIAGALRGTCGGIGGAPRSAHSGIAVVPRVAHCRILGKCSRPWPGTSTSLLSYQVYKLAFSGLYYGYGASVAVFAFLIVLVISVVGYTFMRRSENNM